MILRSGKVYQPNIKITKKVKKKKKNLGVCGICLMEYTSKCDICSCSEENINKHNFHVECLHEALKANVYYPYFMKCPYCLCTIKKFEIQKK